MGKRWRRLLKNKDDEKRVIIEVSGGLGNQMFQYALYRQMKRFSENVYLDLSFYHSNQKLRKFELDIFNISYDVIDEKIAKKYRGYGYNDSLIEKVKRYFFHERNHLYKDLITEFQPQIFTMDNIYLSGYWQNEKYFSEIVEEIQEVYKLSIDGELAEEILNRNSVSIHIRRNDYLYSHNSKIYGNICTNEYYQSAIKYINDHVENPFYYIFSDDISWVKDNLIMANSLVVEHKEDEDHMDMQLMSLCKHNIIANSTFSWWGAWLNSNKEKIVIGPKKWFSNHDHVDVLPSDWILR